jgi:Holliday junction DNA helicase RuvB
MSDPTRGRAAAAPRRGVAPPRDLLRGAPTDEDRRLDESVRPTSLSEFVGQEKVVENLRIFAEAARRRGETLDHVLFSGPPGLGKTTLARILAQEMEVEMRATSGPVIERAADLAGVLTNLARGAILFVDEIHRLSRVVEEYLYPAMEEFAIDILIDKGPNARSLKLSLERFTLVGATTRSGMLSSPLRSRFGVVFRLDYYRAEEIGRIVRRSAGLLSIPVDDDGVGEIACRARGTPRVANRLLRRVRDFAEVEGDGRITRDVARAALDRMEVDRLGLDEMDRRILSTLIEKFRGGPVGIGTLAIACSEEGETIEEVHEPFLVQMGLLNRTSRGREATPLAFQHLGVAMPRGRSASLFPEA